MKKLITTALTLALVGSMATTAFAAVEPQGGDVGGGSATGNVSIAGSTGSAEALLTAEAITFSVTVPTALLVNVDESGVVTTATDAKIENKSAGAVLVSNVVFTPNTGWTGIEFGKDMSAVKVGTKEVGFKINGSTTDSTGAFVFTASNFPAIAAVNDGTTDELPLAYDATVAAQKTALSNAKMADVVFTIGWDAVN